MAGPDNRVDPEQIEKVRRQVNRLADEIAQLSEKDLPAGEYYGEFLQRVLAAVLAPAGAVWLRTPQGNLQLAYQIRMREVGLDAVANGRQIHDELLRHAVMKGQPAMLPPQSGLSVPEEGKIAPGNPTNFVILMAPILVEKQVAGLVEVWQDPNRGQDAQRGFLQFLIKMAALASTYTKNNQLRQMSSQQQVWTDLEKFTRQLHKSLNPTEVAYVLANEGRRLVECDRISVCLVEGGKPKVIAVSGSDTVEKRSNLVQLMRKLFQAVLEWGEKLVYSGTKDETLPPKVLRALDNYLAESNSKLLLVLPLRDEREEESKKPPRSAAIMESFEPEAAPEQMVSRMEVVGKHAASALYNAAEYRRIPFRFLWMPLAKVQEGLGGKTKAIIFGITLGLVLLTAALILVPYPLKLEANGQLLPVERRWIYAPRGGFVKDFKKTLQPNTQVPANDELIEMYSDELRKSVNELEYEIALAEREMREAAAATKDGQPSEDLAVTQQYIKAKITAEHKRRELDELLDRANAVPNKAGYFWVRSPLSGVILTAEFRESLKGRYVTPEQQLIRVGNADPYDPRVENWEIELKIPQKHIGQVLAAFKTDDPKETLDVDFLVRSLPTHTFRGKLLRESIAAEANAEQTGADGKEPEVIARVRVSGDDIPEGYRLTPEHLGTAGIEVRARVRCGNHALGYSMFYGLWEFVYERVVFFFF